MTTFVNGESDVLLSTTIIESGLDIPNANTIIIDRADRFGLSDLYQLRGRVGPLQTPGLRLPAAAAPRRPADRRAQTHQRHQTIFQPRQRLQNRHARPGNSRRGQPARRGAKRAHHGRRLRALLPVAQAKRQLAQRRKSPAARSNVQVRLDFLARRRGRSATGRRLPSRQLHSRGATTHRDLPQTGASQRTRARCAH